MGFLNKLKNAFGGGKDKAKAAAAKTEAKVQTEDDKAKAAAAKTEAKVEQTEDKAKNAAEDAADDLK